MVDGTDPAQRLGDAWVQTTLGEALTHGGGELQVGPYGSELHASDYCDQGVGVIMPRDLVDRKIQHDKVVYVTEAKAEGLSRYRMRTHDVVLARRGDMGRCALVTPAEDGWLCGTGSLLVRCGTVLDPRFLAHFFRWSRSVAWLEENCVGQTMRNLNQKIVRSMPLRLPPLEEQKKLADLLDDLGQSLDLHRQLLHHEVRFQRGAVRGLSLGAGVGLDTLPEGWTFKPLGELAKFINGRAFKSGDWIDGGTPIIRIQNLNGSQNFKHFNGWPKANWWVEEGDLLFAWSGTRQSFGPYLWSGRRGVLNQHIYRLEVRPDVDKLWLYGALQELKWVIEQRSRGFKKSLQHIRKKDIVQQKVAVPPLDVQRKIASMTHGMMHRNRCREEVIQTIPRLADEIANRFFEGTLHR